MTITFKQKLKIIGKRIRVKRVELDLTRKNLAKISGINKKDLIKIEKGAAKRVNLFQLIDICTALKLDLLTLLEGI